MQEAFVQASAEAERKELDTLLVHLERTPRLANLLRYLAQKYFEGDTHSLTEYNIATEVFGRKKSDFVASEDAIARVETHRLRKRLKIFYETEGKEHSVQLLIPPGTYVPVFIDQSAEGRSPVETTDGTEELYSNQNDAQNGDLLPEASEAGLGVPSHATYITSQPAPWRRTSFYVLIAAIAVGSVFGIYMILRTQRISLDGNSPYSQAITANARTPKPLNLDRPHAPSVALPFRLIAGYSGPPQRDSAGDIWQADQYHHDGWAERQPIVFVARTSDPLIFRTGRAGNFSYNIPLNPGVYELHLYFLQPSETAQSEDAENQAVFNMSVNGETALSSFDIVSDAMGRNVADERVLRDISPAPDGMLHLHFSTVIGTPSLSAIQLLEGTPGKQLPIRVITQSTSFTDHEGNLWHPDNYFLGGRHLSHDLPANGSSDPDLLSTERYGHFSYAFPVDPRDRYTVVLHFVELFFGTEEAGASGKGSRVFRVLCNGNTLLDNFDIYKEAGNLHLLNKTFYHVKPTAQGKLNLTFEPVSNYATVSAIEVLDESN